MDSVRDYAGKAWDAIKNEFGGEAEAGQGCPKYNCWGIKNGGSGYQKFGSEEAAATRYLSNWKDYVDKGYNTVDKYLNRWVAPKEAGTDPEYYGQYVNGVKQAIGGNQLEAGNAEQAISMMKAQALYEQGVSGRSFPISDQAIEAAAQRVFGSSYSRGPVEDIGPGAGRSFAAESYGDTDRFAPTEAPAWVASTPGSTPADLGLQSGVSPFGWGNNFDSYGEPSDSLVAQTGPEETYVPNEIASGAFDIGPQDVPPPVLTDAQIGGGYNDPDFDPFGDFNTPVNEPATADAGDQQRNEVDIAANDAERQAEIERARNEVDIAANDAERQTELARAEERRNEVDIAASDDERRPLQPNRQAIEQAQREYVDDYLKEYEQRREAQQQAVANAQKQKALDTLNAAAADVKDRANSIAQTVRDPQNLDVKDLAADVKSAPTELARLRAAAREALDKGAISKEQYNNVIRGSETLQGMVSEYAKNDKYFSEEYKGQVQGALQGRIETGETRDQLAKAGSALAQVTDVPKTYTPPPRTLGSDASSGVSDAGYSQSQSEGLIDGGALDSGFGLSSQQVASLYDQLELDAQADQLVESGALDSGFGLTSPQVASLYDHLDLENKVEGIDWTSVSFHSPYTDTGLSEDINEQIRLAAGPQEFVPEEPFVEARPDRSGPNDQVAINDDNQVLPLGQNKEELDLERGEYAKWDDIVHFADAKSWNDFGQDETDRNYRTPGFPSAAGIDKVADAIRDASKNVLDAFRSSDVEDAIKNYKSPYGDYFGNYLQSPDPFSQSGEDLTRQVLASNIPASDRFTPSGEAITEDVLGSNFAPVDSSDRSGEALTQDALDSSFIPPDSFDQSGEALTESISLYNLAESQKLIDEGSLDSGFDGFTGEQVAEAYRDYALRNTDWDRLVLNDDVPQETPEADVSDILPADPSQIVPVTKLAAPNQLIPNVPEKPADEVSAADKTDAQSPETSAEETPAQKPQLPAACFGPSVAACSKALGKEWSESRNEIAKDLGVSCTPGSASCNRQILKAIVDQGGLPPPLPQPRDPYSRAAQNYPTGDSLVNFLKAGGLPSDYLSRADFAKENGIDGYKGTAAQNLQLLQCLRDPSCRK